MFLCIIKRSCWSEPEWLAWHWFGAEWKSEKLKTCLALPPQMDWHALWCEKVFCIAGYTIGQPDSSEELEWMQCYESELRIGLWAVGKLVIGFNLHFQQWDTQIEEKGIYLISINVQNIGAKTKTGVLFRFGQIESRNSFDFFFFKAMPLVLVRWNCLFLKQCPLLNVCNLKLSRIRLWNRKEEASPFYCIGNSVQCAAVYSIQYIV